MLNQELAAGYWQPLDEDQIPGDGDWSKMPRETRDSSGERRLVSQISIREVRGTFRLRFKIQGTKRVPWAMEFGLRKGGQLSGVRSLDGVEGAYLPTESAWSYRVGSDEIRVSHGPVEHQWVQLRGAEPKLEAECVYFTGFTPLDLELTVG